MEYMYNNEHCNGFICCRDFNTCFNRVNDFVSRNNLAVSWDHKNSVRDLTYVNTDLSHFSCIDHFIVSKNMFDCIINNFVVHDICNPSYHNLLLLTLSITCFNYIINARNTCTRDSKRAVNWKKASHENIAEYKSHLKKNVHCKLAIPFVRSGNGDMPGWTEQVKPELDQAKCWHWMWQKAGKPQSGAAYEVMKRTKHHYHYAVRRCKRNKPVIQKETLARNISKSREFCTELKKINPTSTIISGSIGSANGSTEITKLLYNKYHSLYSSVPTDDNELCEIHDSVNSRLSTSTHITVTPDIIKQCIHKLKPGEDDGDFGFLFL